MIQVKAVSDICAEYCECYIGKCYGKGKVCFEDLPEKRMEYVDSFSVLSYRLKI